METTTISINDLISPTYNPRQISKEEMQKLENSITEFGLVSPIVINLKNNHIIGGNQRFNTLLSINQKKGDFYKELTLIKLGDIGLAFIDEDLKVEDEDHEKALNLALNKISGEWDFQKLTDLLDELDLNGFDISLSGFDGLDDLDFDLDGDYNPDEDEYEIEEDEYEEPDDLEVTVQQGDIYGLGNHRLMCGDSNNEEDINLLIDNNDIDMLFTDPPYGISVVNTSGTIGGDKPFGSVGGDGVVKAKEYKPVLNDDKPYDPSILLELDIPSIIWGANNFSSKLPDSSRWLVWFKKSKGDDYDTTFSDAELAWTNYDGKSVKLYQHTWTGMVREGDRRDELTERVHPTQKPVGLLARILNDYGRERETMYWTYMEGVAQH